MARPAEEMLYVAMEDYRVDVRIADGLIAEHVDGFVTLQALSCVYYAVFLVTALAILMVLTAEPVAFGLNLFTGAQMMSNSGISSNNCVTVRCTPRAWPK